jgi:hypothetical protein
MHPTDGEIRAMLDSEWGEGGDDARLHIQSCPACRQRADELSTAAGRVYARLDTLSAGVEHFPAPAPRAAERSLNARLNNHLKERESMFTRIFKRIPRLTWVAMAAIVVLAVALSFPSVQALASNFLSLFRVQKISVVQVDPANFSNQTGSPTQFENLLAQDIQFDKPGEPQPAADPAAAAKMAGMTVRLPAAAQGTPTLMVQPGSKAAIKVNLEHIQALLDAVGKGDVKLPASIDGKEIRVSVPASVSARYGTCDFAEIQSREEAMAAMASCTALIQIPSPSIDAPADLPIDQLGQAYLQLLGLKPEDAARFAKNVDWTSTFVIPVPRYSTEYIDVNVDGVQGTYIKQPGGVGQYLLIWVKDGVIYALTGRGGMDNALQIANSIR